MEEEVEVEEEDGLNNNNQTSTAKTLINVLMRLPFLLLCDDVLFKEDLLPFSKSNNTLDTGQVENKTMAADNSTADFFSLSMITETVLFQSLFKLVMLTVFFIFKNSDLKKCYMEGLNILVPILCIHAFISFNEEYTMSMFEIFTDNILIRVAIVCSIKIVMQLVLGQVLLLCYRDVEQPEAVVPLLKETMLTCLSVHAFLSALVLPESWLGVSGYVCAAPAALLLLLLLYKITVEDANVYLLLGNRDMELIQNFGLPFYLESRWTMARIPLVLRTYWCLRFAFTILQSWSELSLVEGFSWSGLYSDGEVLLVRGCESYVALLGMTSVISLISHAIGLVFQNMLKLDDSEKSFASVSAILFFILALQTGLPDLTPEKRFYQLCKNGCLLLTAVLHYVHSLVDTTLVSLASSTNNKNKHIRGLFVCLCLLVFPVVLLVSLWSRFTVGTWILAVTVFCIEAVIKVLVTLTIYFLTIWDVYYQDGVWESFDDWIFYIKSFGNSVQFVFAVFLFLNGGWVLFFEAGGSFRALMMGIHAYYNIWLEAKSGWSTFWKRRTAAGKVGSLQDATPEQITKNADVCPICYQAMSAAKITRCRHLFHNSCLKKWLQKQDSCPMCLEPLHKVDATSQTEEVHPPLLDNMVLEAMMNEANEELDRMFENNSSSDEEEENDDIHPEENDDIQPEPEMDYRRELGHIQEVAN